MTRSSTTTSRKALDIDTLSMVNDFYTASPYAAAAITCGTKASAADYVAQSSSMISNNNDNSNDDKKKNDFELARNAAFVLYGAMYQGMAQEYIYNHLYPVWFGTDTASVQVVLTKVCFDLLIQTTLVTLPIAYLAKAMIFQYSPQQAMELYKQDILERGLLLKYYALWGPVQCLTFSIVPETYRVTFIAVVSFFWIIILSSISSRPRPSQEGEA